MNGQPQPTQQPQPQTTQPPVQQQVQPQTAQPQPTQPQPAQPQPVKKKSCLVPCLIIFAVFIIICVVGWFVFRPMFFKWLCRKGSQEQGLIKLDESAYYNLCLKKYHIE